MNFYFPKSTRLCKRWQYQRVAKQHTRHIGHWVIVEMRKNNRPYTRLGVTVSRRYGKAVDRNRFKRVVREAFRLCRQELQQGLDLNIKPRTSANQAKTADIVAELRKIQAS